MNNEADIERGNAVHREWLAQICPDGAYPPYIAHHVGNKKNTRAKYNLIARALSMLILVNQSVYNIYVLNMSRKEMSEWRSSEYCKRRS